MTNVWQDHHESHQSLLRSGDAVQSASIDAIIVPTIRPPAYLAPAAGLAKALGCTLVTLHSKRWTSAAIASQRINSSVDLLAIDVPKVLDLRMPAWSTSQMLTGEFARLRPLSDLSAKRNLGIVLSRLLGWSRVMFLDDDITALNPQDVRRASGWLDKRNAVGLHVCGFHDHSVVCHAYRDAGGAQKSFIGGGALVVQVRTTRSFFPDIYNDDWFYLLDEDNGILPVAVEGRVEQYRYDPFRSPDRARDEEFGDVLAEGIYWLLDQGLSIAKADNAHWAAFLVKRKQFILRVRGMVNADAALDPAERARRLDALTGSIGRLARITPELCVQYLKAWKADRKSWHRHVEMLSPAMDRAHAVSMLTRTGAPGLDYRIGACNTSGAIVEDSDMPAVRGPSVMLPTLGPTNFARPTHQRQLVTAGRETSCSIGKT